jgi:hypothetical protein
VPLTDISRVTTAIATLITQALARDNFPDPFEVTAAPPQDQSNASPNAISLYLFHVIEDPHRKNLPPRQPISSTVPVQFTQMGLVLNYVITARNTVATGGGDRALIEQRLLGYVARALHDFPVITDGTTIPPNIPVLETAGLSGSNNKIDLILRPVGIDESVNFWRAEEELTARLALFYEARVILLSTPRITSTTGTVFSLGGFVTVAGQPFLQGVRNTIGFVLPPGFGSPDPTSPFQFVASNPARASLFPAGPIPVEVAPDNNRLRIEGSDLRSERTLLVLRGQAGIGAGAPEEQSFRIDAMAAASNPDWAFDVRGTEILAGVRQTVLTDDGTSLTLYPGLFSLRVITARQIPGDTSGRRLEQSSNEVVFAVTPQVISVAGMGGPPAARQFRLTVFGSYLRDELDIQLSVGGEVLTRDADTTTAGNYDFNPNSDQIDFAVDTTGRPSPLPVNLLINGAGSTPAWAVF